MEFHATRSSKLTTSCSSASASSSKFPKLLKARRRIQRLCWFCLVAIAALSFIAFGQYSESDNSGLAPQTIKGRFKRSSQTNTTTSIGHNCVHNLTSEEGNEFPNDLFSQQQLRHGAVLLHMVGLLYVFVGTAIVCDEFFVPTLDVIIERLDISDDIAGATFMAAGGSAPELLVAMIGSFISRSNVGVGTIVGSASFNILFAVAMCTMLMKDRFLTITPWPFCRDMSFYFVALLILFLTFMDEKVHWYESVSMLMIYCIYVCFMCYNSSFENLVRRLRRVFSSVFAIHRKVQPIASAGSGDKPKIFVVDIDQSLSDSPEVVLSDSELTPRSRRHHPMVRRNNSLIRTLSMRRVKEKGNFRQRICTDPGLPDDKKVTDSDKRRTKSVGWFGDLHDYTSSTKEYSFPSAECLPKRTTLTVTIAPTTELDNCNVIHDNAIASQDDDEPKPVDLSWPDSHRERLMYLLLAPITFALAYTIPDVRDQKRKKLFAFSFFMSIVWIGLFSYMGVWWAGTIGETIGISDEVMGLTILAAGSSVPDALNSIIVARRGLGDMAIASSIGSNIFAVTIGLQTPWLLQFVIQAFRGTPLELIAVQSNGLACSLGLLFVALVLLIGLVVTFRWRLDRRFGVALLLIYAVYLTTILLIETHQIHCPLKLHSAGLIKC